MEDTYCKTPIYRNYFHYGIRGLGNITVKTPCFTFFKNSNILNFIMLLYNY